MFFATYSGASRMLRKQSYIGSQRAVFWLMDLFLVSSFASLITSQDVSRKLDRKGPDNAETMTFGYTCATVIPIARALSLVAFELNSQESS